MAETQEQMKTGGPKQNADEPKSVEPKSAEKKSGARRLLVPTIFGAIILSGALYGWHIIQYNKIHESTDDAQIDADISPIIPRVSGYVARVVIGDNDHVDSGAVLVQLDVSDLALKVKIAEAAVENAQSAVRAAEANAAVARANVGTSDVNHRKTAADLSRARGLLAGGAITQEQFDAIQAAAESADAQFKSVTDQASAAGTQVVVAESQVKQRQADLDNTNLQFAYTTITSPVAGTVAKKNVQVGEYIQAGQPLMAITPANLWITANFKETQLEDMHPGQPVEFTLDSYPDSVFHGTVQSISPATGAKFSLLPPDNASGNFVKVTQRVPVKILVDPRDYSRSPLRPGMSVDVTVSTIK